MNVTTTGTKHFPIQSTKTSGAANTATASAPTKTAANTAAASTKSATKNAATQISSGISIKPTTTFATITSTKATAKSLDFTKATKADFLAWGKAQLASGKINQDEMFRVEFEAGELNGTTGTDTAPQDFVKTFQNRVQFLNSMGSYGHSNATSYTHLLSVMAGSISKTA